MRKKKTHYTLDNNINRSERYQHGPPNGDKITANDHIKDYFELKQWQCRLYNYKDARYNWLQVPGQVNSKTLRKR